MKDSGIAWIGEIPEGWEVVRLGKIGQFSASGIDKKIVEGETLVSMINYVDVYNNLSHKLLPKEYMVVSAPKDKCFEHQVLIGDMIFTPSSETIEDIGVSAVVMEYLPNTVYSYHVLRYRNTSIDIQFKKYICNNNLIQNYFSSRATGSIRKTLSRQDFKDCAVPLPPLVEQQAIADFLDKKCGEIDELVSLQEKMIEELKAYKQSVITEAVTKGLNPDVPMKDSGIAWIGEIPEGWGIVKFKYALSLLKRPVRESDEVVTCFRDGEVILRSLRRTEGFTFSDKEIGYQGINEGDIVIHGMDGFAGAMGISKSTGKGSPVLIVCAPKENSNSSYVIYFLKMLAINNVFLALATGIRERSCDLRWNKISELLLLLPPIAEQRAIADFLDEKCTQIDNLISLKQTKIEELKAYKKSLIYEYVTGKKQVV